MNELIEAIENLKHLFKLSTVESLTVKLTRSSSSATIDDIEVLGVGKHTPTNRDALEACSDKKLAIFLDVHELCDHHPDACLLSEDAEGDHDCKNCMSRWLAAPFKGDL